MTFLNRAHRIATVCGAAPLLVGTAIFVAWLVTRRDWLMLAGAVVLYGGAALVATGVVALALSLWSATRTPDAPIRRIRVSALSCGGLLLANILAAGCILWAGIAIATRYTVVVINASQQRLDSVRVFGGGCDASYGSLLPGATARRSFWIRQDGTLVLHASEDKDTLEQTIDDYVTGNSGGYLKITVQPELTLSIKRVAPNQLTLIDRARDAALWSDNEPCKQFERKP